jgi:hypothetical protein
MGYYAAGGYYRAGGFNFKKLTKFVAKVAKNPIIQAGLSFIPGAGTIVSGLQLLDQVGGPSIQHALATGSAGTPGHNASQAGPLHAMQHRNRMRRKGRRGPRKRAW